MVTVMKVRRIRFVFSLLFLNSIHQGISYGEKRDNFGGTCTKVSECIQRAKDASGVKFQDTVDNLSEETFCKYLQEIKSCRQEQGDDSCNDGLNFQQIIEQLIDELEKKEKNMKCDSTVNVPSLIFVTISCILTKIF